MSNKDRMIEDKYLIMGFFFWFFVEFLKYI